MLAQARAARACASGAGRGDLSQRIAIKTGVELEGLADQFNDMAGQLQESYAGLEKKVEQRTHELSESLDQQTATSEVLRVISSSPGDLKPVFETMLANATRLCQAKFGNLFLREGGMFRAVAIHGESTYLDLLRRDPVIDVGKFPYVPLGRLLETKDVVHVSDLTAER